MKRPFKACALRSPEPACWRNTTRGSVPRKILGPGDDTFEPLIFSAQYKAEHWSLTSEYARRPPRTKASSSEAFPNFDLDIVGESYYIQGIYRLDPHWEMVLRYDVFYANVDDRDGSKTEARYGNSLILSVCQGLDRRRALQHPPSWMVRAEYHNVYGGTLYLLPQDNPDPFALSKKWDIFALLLSYRF